MKALDQTRSPNADVGLAVRCDPNLVRTAAPLQPVAGSPCPVMVKPLRFSEMSGAPNEMQGAATTRHVTSPTKRKVSPMTSVLTMTPWMSSARATPADHQRLNDQRGQNKCVKLWHDNPSR